MAERSLTLSTFRIVISLLLLVAIGTAFTFLPVEQKLKDFMLWIKEDLGPFGPLALALAYIPLTIVAVPASVLTLGGGYLFGFPVGFVADSLGATSPSLLMANCKDFIVKKPHKFFNLINQRLVYIEIYSCLL